MDKPSDTISQMLFNSLELKVQNVPDSENISTYSTEKSIKKHKQHNKSKKHKKHKKKSKKSSKKKQHTQCSSSDDYVFKKDKSEEATSGKSASVDVVIETIVTVANENSEAVKLDDNENCNFVTTSVDENKVQTLENDSNQKNLSTTRLNNGKIIIKDLKDSRLYNELANEVQLKERVKHEKFINNDHSSSTHDVDENKKREKHKSKKKKRSRSRNRSSTPIQHKKYRKSHSNSSKDRVRHDDFKSGQTNSKNQCDSNTKCRNTYSDIKSKEKSSQHKTSIAPVNKLKVIRRSTSRDSYKAKRSKDYSRTKIKSQSKGTSRTRYRSPSYEKIDKNALFKIAHKNAQSLVEQGVLPEGSVKKNSKTLDELTDFCHKLSKKDKDQDDNTSYFSDDYEFKQPFRHPFLVKETPNLNAINATQLLIKSFNEKTVGQNTLSKWFPESSNQTYRLALNECVPIAPEGSAKLNKIHNPDEGNKLSSESHPSHQLVPVIQRISSPNYAVVPLNYQNYQYVLPPVEPPAFVTPYANGSYSLLPFEMGQFTGNTSAKVLTTAEQSVGFQICVKKDLLKNSAPVKSDIGVHLLEKIEWKPGESLGKNQSGSLEPLLLDIKMDKKGLVTEEEIQGNCIKRYPKKAILPMLSLEGKHPVSFLIEFCSKSKWGIPKFNIEYESGPVHKKTFIMTVDVNGVQYCSSKCPSKKLAKMEAAEACLKEIGLLN